MAMDGAVGSASLVVTPPEEIFSHEDEKHPSCSFETLNEFRESGFLCDVKIKVEERVFPCHRVVLAATIPYFRSMFSSGMKESREKAIDIGDISADAFEGILAFCYTSRLQLAPHSVQPLLFAASILQVDSVCGGCEEFLTQNLTVQNCIAIRSLAQQHNCVKLMETTDTFSAENFKLREHPEFEQITFAHLREIIKRSDLHVSSEEQVYDSVMGWVEVDVDRRKEHLHALLSHVRLAQLNTAFLFERVRSHPLIKDDPDCSRLVLDTLHEQFSGHSAGLRGGEAVVGLGWKNPAHPMTSGAPVDPVAAKAAAERSRPRKSAAGVVFCVGGKGPSGPVRTVEAYDWRRDKWFPVKEMGVKRWGVGVVSAEGKLYASGGRDVEGEQKSAECFEPVQNVWKSIASMGNRRTNMALGYLNGAIYAVGGWHGQTVERYDIEADRWSDVAKMNAQRAGVGVATLGKYLFAVGGKDLTTSFDSVEKYDPHLDSWTLVKQMSHRRAGCGVAVLSGFLYAIGGYDSNTDTTLSSCERYDPVRNEWTMLPSMSCPRVLLGVAAMGGRIYAVGGHDGQRDLDSVEAYDPEKNCWEPVASISHCRIGAGVAWCQCSVETFLSV